MHFVRSCTYNYTCTKTYAIIVNCLVYKAAFTECLCHCACLVLQNLQRYSIVLIKPWHQVLTVIVWIMLVRYGRANVLMLLYQALPDHPAFTLQGIVSYHILKAQFSYWYTRVKIRTTVLAVSLIHIACNFVSF